MAKHPDNSWRILAVVRASLIYIGKIIRWWEWHDSKLPMCLVAISYALLQLRVNTTNELVVAAWLLAMLMLFAAFGHMVNDYSDIEVDRVAGKLRPLASWSPVASFSLITLSGLLIPLISIVNFSISTSVITTLTILLACLYSLPPLRLKERGIGGWIVASLTQRTLPIVIVFQAFNYWDWAAVAICILGTVIGLRCIAIHQINDLGNDHKANVRTVATQQGATRLLFFLKYISFPIEVLTALVMIVLLAPASPALAVLGLAYALWQLIAYRRGKPISPRSYDLFHDFYNMLLPITLSATLAYYETYYLPVLFICVLLQYRSLRFRYLKWRRPAIMSTPDNNKKEGHSAGTVGQARIAGEQKRVELSKDDPYPFYAKLRKEGPVHRMVWPTLGQAWLVVTYDDGLNVFKDPRFVKNRDNIKGGPGIQPDPNRTSRRGFGPDLVDMDPPDHTRLRNLVTKAFTPRIIEERLGQRVQELSDEILDKASDNGNIELIAQYAATVPITIITELLGVPIRDIRRFRRFTYLLSLGRSARRKHPELQQESRHFASHLKKIFAKRRAEPRNDLVSALVLAEQDGDRLDESELLGMTYLLLLGGYVTTLNLIGNGFLSLLRHPNQLDMLRQDPTLIDTAIEELLRYESPLELSSVHYASEDIEMGNKTVPTGSQVYVVIPSANRDASGFPDAHKLDITRQNCRHLSFGQGIHYCLGAPLARMEGRIALLSLVQRFSSIKLAVAPSDIKWLMHPVLRGLQQLPLRLQK